MHTPTPYTPVTDFSSDEEQDFFTKRSQQKALENERAKLDPVKPACSIVLQGSPKKAKERLFLFPDGCGAATSYVKIQKIAESTSLIGFNSPIMK